MKKETVIDKLKSVSVVPLMYHADAALCASRIQACYDAGIRAFEFTNRGSQAQEVFSAIRKYIDASCPEMALGIGTIYDAATARAYIDLGTDFIVQPIMSEEVGAVCHENNIAWIPAAMTVTEIYTAHRLGASVVKIFPASVLGKAFIKAIRGPMPNVPLMVTGGVKANKEDVQEWLAAGANNVGLGGQLFDDPAYNTRITEILKEILN
jgi:2-dehydro-3-deoxyphosphogluconate aldolase / (4S)-4-hydroxy-2-oxoglutarate aldolase